jgi:hypothetical protein
MDMDTVPGRIFVSYRRHDSAYPTGWLTDRLVEHYGPKQVFTDVDSIELGDDYAKKITLAVASCDVLLAVIGPGWLAAQDEDGRRRLDDPEDYVRVEIEAALRRRALVVPILVDGASMPRVSDLPGRPVVPGGDPEPGSLATLPFREALALHPEQFDWAVGRLLKKLDAVLIGDEAEDESRASGPGPERTDVPAFTGSWRWALIGILSAAVALLLLVVPRVLPDVRDGRAFQPQADSWLAFIWLLPGITALVPLAVVIAKKTPAIGAALGLTVVAAWMVASSWAQLEQRKAVEDPHASIHAVLVILLLAAGVGLAASPPLRERVQANNAGQMVVAVCLAVAGFLVQSQASGLAKAVVGESAPGGLWQLDSESWSVRVGELIPFIVCVVAGVVHGNADQTRALRTFVGVLVLYQVGIRAASFSKALVEHQVHLASLASVLVAAGCVLYWCAVCVGQPKNREAPWRSRRAAPAVTLP